MQIFLHLLLFLSIFSGTVLADAKSDYEYQYTKYRDHYLEFSVFKKDYLATPSLDNQQKVLLSLKQSLLARDLTKASLSWYLLDLININKVDYEQLKPIITSLNTARQYYLSKANEAQTVVTLQNLKSYTEDYLTTSLEPERALKYGIVGHKIAKLVRIQQDSKKALDSLAYKLPDTVSIRVKERLQDLEKGHQLINSKIEEIANYVISEEGKESADSPIFFAGRVEKLDEIRTLQMDWIDQLIDLDLNYGKI